LSTLPALPADTAVAVEGGGGAAATGTAGTTVTALGALGTHITGHVTCGLHTGPTSTPSAASTRGTARAAGDPTGAAGTPRPSSSETDV
jgi:hypothetical protein